MLSWQALSARTTPNHRRPARRIAHTAKGRRAEVHHVKYARRSRYTRRYRRSSWKRRGQQKIDDARATQIQQALIREKYLTGEPTGEWDTATQEALQHYQSDHGWQTKMVPDARAIISLGLGPKPENLLNPETAVRSKYAPPANSAVAAVSGNVAPVAVAPASSNTGAADPAAPASTQTMQFADQRR